MNHNNIQLNQLKIPKEVSMNPNHIERINTEWILIVSPHKTKALLARS